MTLFSLTSLSTPLELISIGVRLTTGLTIGGLMVGRRYRFIRDLSNDSSYSLLTQTVLKIVAYSIGIFAALSCFLSLFSCATFSGLPLIRLCGYALDDPAGNDLLQIAAYITCAIWVRGIVPLYKNIF